MVNRFIHGVEGINITKKTLTLDSDGDTFDTIHIIVTVKGYGNREITIIGNINSKLPDFSTDTDWCAPHNRNDSYSMHANKLSITTDTKANKITIVADNDAIVLFGDKSVKLPEVITHGC